MRLADFRKQKLAKVQEDLRLKGAASSSIGSGSPYDNIFKTLMDEMTSLEINQSIFDVYVSNLHNCFVQVVDEVLLEQERLRLEASETVGMLQSRLSAVTDTNEQLLLRLARLENNFLASSAAWVISLVAVLLLVCTQVLALREKKKQQQPKEQHYQHTNNHCSDNGRWRHSTNVAETR